jgi:hypothetical protein
MHARVCHSRTAAARFNEATYFRQNFHNCMSLKNSLYMSGRAAFKAVRSNSGRDSVFHVAISSRPAEVPIEIFSLHSRRSRSGLAVSSCSLSSTIRRYMDISSFPGVLSCSSLCSRTRRHPVLARDRHKASIPALTFALPCAPPSRTGFPSKWQGLAPKRGQ